MKGIMNLSTISIGMLTELTRTILNNLKIFKNPSKKLVKLKLY